MAIGSFRLTSPSERFSCFAASASGCRLVGSTLQQLIVDEKTLLGARERRMSRQRPLQPRLQRKLAILPFFEACTFSSGPHFNRRTLRSL